jgi:hypothetical protein
MREEGVKRLKEGEKMEPEREIRREEKGSAKASGRIERRVEGKRAEEGMKTENEKKKRKREGGGEKRAGLQGQ